MAIDPQSWLDIVKALAAQNGSVRVSLSSAPVEQGGRFGRTRVLALGKDGVTVVEEPRYLDMGVRLRPGTQVDLLAVGQDLRLVGRCKVAAQLKYALNQKMRVDALSLTTPTKVFSGQLRDFYRAPVGASLALEPVRLSLDSLDEPTAERARAAGVDLETQHKARLVNISSGGVGLALLVDAPWRSALTTEVVCRIYADLPTLDKPLEQRSRVVHVHKLDSGDIYMGMRFEFDNPSIQRQVENEIQHLSVWLQRQQLKKDRRD